MVTGSLRRTSKTLLALVLGAAFALPARAALSWQPQGPAFQVNSYALSDQLHPAVATDADGNFVVLWIDKLRGLFLRRFDATGAPLTPEIRVDDPPIPAAWLARQDLPRLAMAAKNGGFAVVYSSSDGIWIHRFNAIAQSLDRIGLPYNSTGELLLEPDAVYDGAGSLQVVWRATTPARTFILLQRFDPQGRAEGGASPANQVITGARRRPRLALVGYTLTVTDTQTGKQKAYRNDPGTLASRADTEAF